MSQQGRSVWRMIVQNFIKSLNVRPTNPKFVGKDDLGNKYFEAEKGSASARAHPVRWFEPEEEGKWQQNLPAEWEAWLRNRRKDPPTIKEIAMNAAIAQIKKEKGDEIRKKSEEERAARGEYIPETEGNKGFKFLEGLERDPGSSYDEKK